VSGTDLACLAIAHGIGVKAAKGRGRGKPRLVVDVDAFELLERLAASMGRREKAIACGPRGDR
jgi:hypothetical protein